MLYWITTSHYRLLNSAMRKQLKIQETKKHYFISNISSQKVSSNSHIASRKLLRIKETPDLHLTYSKNGGNLGLELKMKNIACISILLTKHVKYIYLYLFKFVLYSVVAFKANY